MLGIEIHLQKNSQDKHTDEKWSSFNVIIVITQQRAYLVKRTTNQIKSHRRSSKSYENEYGGLTMI